MSYPKNTLSLDKYGQYNLKLRSLKLTPTQRKKLLNSHRQEEIKSMILFKYLEKQHLSKTELQSNPLLQQIITTSLQNEKLSEKNLAQLCEKLKYTIKNIKVNSQLHNGNLEHKETTIDVNKERIPSKNELIQSDHRIVCDPNENINYETNHDSDSENEKKSLYKDNEGGNEWSMIVKYRQKKYEEEIKNTELRKKQKKELFKQELDRQLLQKKDFDKINYQKDSFLDNKIKDFQDKQESQLSEKLLKRKRLLEMEQKAREEQLRDYNYRMKREKKYENDFDRSLVRKAKEEFSLEQENQRNKKLDYQESLRKIMIENERNKQNYISTELNQEKNHLMKALTEENMMITRKTNIKNDEIFLRENKLKNLQESISDKFVREKLEKLRIEEQNQMKYVDEYEKKEKRKEEIKKRLYNEQKELIKLSLENQMMEKHDAKKIEEELNRKQAEFWKRDIENYNYEEEMKKLKTKGQNLKTLEVIRQQIEEGQRKKDLIKSMNEEELMQNKQTLKDIATKEEDLKSAIKKTLVPHKKYI